MITTIPAYIARTQFGSLIKRASEKRTRFVITKSGRPRVVLMSVDDFDDMAEELDPVFQKSLHISHKEYKAGKTITLKEYLKDAI